MHRSVIVLAMIFLAAASAPAFPRAKAEPSKTPSPINLVQSVKFLKVRYLNDAQWQAAANVVINTADYFVKNPKINSLTQRSGDGLAEARACEHIVFSTSFAYALTGDPKYAARAADELIFLSSKNDKGEFIYPAWSDGHNLLSVSEMSVCFALGYRWNKLSLSDETRSQILNRLVDAGLRPVVSPSGLGGLGGNKLAEYFSPSGGQYNYGNYAFSNWNGVVNGGLALAASLIDKDERAPEGFTANDQSLYDAIQSGFDTYVPAALSRMKNGSSSDASLGGAWDESLSYYTYFSTYLALFFDAYSDLTGRSHPLESVRAIEQSPSFFIAMTAPSYRQFNFGDADPAVSYVPFSYFGRVFNQPSTIQAVDEYLQWVLPQIGNGPSKSYARLDRFFPFYLLWYEPKPGGSPLSKEPLARIFKGANGDFFSARSSWTDPNALFIAAKGGKPSATHAKMDAGTFVLEGNGQRWVEDIGAYGNYGLNHYFGGPRAQAFKGRWQYFVNNNLSQNTLTFFDGSGDALPQNPLGKGVVSRSVLRFPDAEVSFDLSSNYTGAATQETRTIHISSATSMWIEDHYAPAEGVTKVRWAAVFCKADAATDSIAVQGNSAILKKGGRESQWVIAQPSDGHFVLETVNPFDPSNYRQTPEAEKANGQNHQAESLNMPNLTLCTRLATYADPRKNAAMKIIFTLR